ncbi:MAG: GNAT family N-acetyltransferase [Deltaproteobacteria bacterium]|nr:GNAT family N-acetyltransferase [Deltaproteobacteria bacterium]
MLAHPIDDELTEIRAAAGTDEGAVTAILLLAFSANPPTRWLFPDPARYVELYPRFVHAFGGAAFAHGSADLLADGGGAALWLPPGVDSDGAALVELMREAIDPSRRDATFALLGELAAHRPSQPHWYLPLIGVDPARKLRGLGSALLRHALQRCDRDHQPAYLESSDPKNIPLYERHGFVLQAAVQVGDSPPLFPMLREAR